MPRRWIVMNCATHRTGGKIYINLGHFILPCFFFSSRLVRGCLVTEKCKFKQAWHFYSDKRCTAFPAFQHSLSLWHWGFCVCMYVCVCGGVLSFLKYKASILFSAAQGFKEVICHHTDLCCHSGTFISLEAVWVFQFWSGGGERRGVALPLEYRPSAFFPLRSPEIGRASCRETV